MNLFSLASRRLLLSVSLLLVGLPAAASRAAEAPAGGLFARENLVAWCIVPYDGKKRGPEERAAMLRRLGFRQFAYDWRAEHLPTLDRELDALEKNGIKLTAVWFPGGLNDEARLLLDALARHRIETQLWVTLGGGGPAATPDEQRKKVAEHAAAVRPIAEAAARIGCSVGLYNHGSWFGEPENQLAIIDALRLPNVGIVYNLHHGHDHLDRFPALLQKMKPHLMALNLNGMVAGGDRDGRKILPLGQGTHDLELIKTIASSGYRGPIGILGHTDDDAEERLQDNLDGLDWLVAQLSGTPAGPKPKPRTDVPTPAPAIAGWIAKGKPEYRTPPFTVACRVRLTAKGRFNILVANDTKASAAHWELFTMPGTGYLSAYLPGRQPDHVRTQAAIADKQWHTVTMQYEPMLARLFVDGKQVAEQGFAAPLAIKDGPAGLAFGRLVEGINGMEGELAWASLSTGIVPPPTGEPVADGNTIGLWKFVAGKPAADLSHGKNQAEPVGVSPNPSAAVVPPPGVHLEPADPRMKAVLIDRSPNDAYMGVKVDGMGRIFVGGRDAVFLFEPDDKGGYQPRRQLLTFPKDSIIIGLEFRGNDLYVMTSSALYLVRDGRVKRDGLVAERRLWGLPVDLHVSFHCMVWGPEGDLYLDHGDPLLNFGDWDRPDHWGYWTLFAGPEGTRQPYTGAGAVLRVRPDGSRVRVQARGLRGPVGLAFNPTWNLFTNDNDHESRADKYAPARLLHVSPQADFGWPRGWMASKSPGRSDLLESIHPDLGRGVPCDLAYYDEPLFPSLRGGLLMARWARMTLCRYPLQPKGAGFQAEEQVVATGRYQARPTGVAIGRGGRLFVTTQYLGGNVVSPYCYSDLTMLVPADDPADHPFVAFDETTASTAALWDRLSSPSWEDRRQAHGELLRRGGDTLTEATSRLAAAVDTEPAARHLPWLAALAPRPDEALLEQLARDRSRPVLREQALRALTLLPVSEGRRSIHADLLTDADASLRLLAIGWFLDHDAPPPVLPVARLAGSSDPTERQAAATLLARRVAQSDLEMLAGDADADLRLAAVLAAGRRLTVPLPDAPPPAGITLAYPDGNAFFHRKIMFADAAAPIDLADLGPVGSYTTAQRWKGTTPSAEEYRLRALLASRLHDSVNQVRSQAAYELSLLRDETVEPEVARVQRELREGGLTSLPPQPVEKAWFIGPLPADASSNPAERGPIDLAATYPAEAGPVGWRDITSDKGQFILPDKPGSTYSHFRLASVARQPVLLTASGAGSIRIWHDGRLVPVPDSKSPVMLDLQPGSNDIVIGMVGGGPLALAVRAKAGVATVLPEKAESSLLAERLHGSHAAAAIPPDILRVDWAKEARSGNAEHGRKLFGTLGCAKCHAVTPDQAGGGAPSLTDAGRRFTPAYLVESILVPDRQVADVFRATIIETQDGEQLTGLLTRETPDALELLLPNATRREIARKDVEARRTSATSPMPAGLVKTADEVRDLLTYLLGDRPLPP